MAEDGAREAGGSASASITPGVSADAGALAPLSMSPGEKAKVRLQLGQVALAVRGGMTLLANSLLKPQWGQVRVMLFMAPPFTV